jgi:hypothetical protein
MLQFPTLRVRSWLPIVIWNSEISPIFLCMNPFRVAARERQMHGNKDSGQTAAQSSSESASSPEHEDEQVSSCSQARAVQDV